MAAQASGKALNLTADPVVDVEAEDGVKCDNHPQRKAKTYTNGGAVQNFCDECAPEWYKDSE